MSNRFFTLLLVRHARPRFRKLRLSYAFVAAAAATGTLVLVAGLMAPGMFLELRERSVALDRLQHENTKLWNEKGYFEGALNQMSTRIRAFEEGAGAIADELGVQDLPSSRPASGGENLTDRAVEHFPFEQELRYLQARTETLDRSFEQLADAFAERERELRATPNGMPIQGWFSHGFGWRKDPWTGVREFHRGLDIVTDAGVEILAPANGIVSRVGRYPDYGNSIDIHHGYGYVTRYAHMSDLLVKAGDRVDRGQAVGRVGSTGRSTGPHLHYEVFRDGKRVNPWKYLGTAGG
jgi:murein DD-endopeptidase MepM/ murein hydrolase activator NlpD